MRRQELIYAQAEGFVRNRDINLVNTSSDICIFESPIFDVTGATKILSGLTSSSNGVHLITNDEYIDFTFEFVDNLSFLSNDLNFNYSVYKFNEASQIFNQPPTYKSQAFSYPTFSATNVVTDSIAVSGLTIDGEYLIKGSYDYKVCTHIFSELGLRNITTSFTNTGEYDLYNSTYDYYFAAIYSARTPIFDLNPDTERPIGAVNVISIIPSGETAFTIDDGFTGAPIITLNGSVLSDEGDYVLSGNTIILSEPTVTDDIINLIYVGKGSTNGLVSNSKVINSSILSGATGGQGNEFVYYNTDSNKYELYTDSDPISGNDVIISLNGAVLANNIDYYQSISDKRRFILQGDIVIGDVITIVYNGKATYVGGINTNVLKVYWTIDKSPQKNNGEFILQVATDKEFTNITSSGQTSYIANTRVYSNSVNLVGSIGDKLYYRVRNIKNYVTITGDIIESTADSEIIPIIIQSNSLNSY